MKQNNLDFDFILKNLFYNEISTVLVEAGKNLTSSLITKKYFNEFYLFISSKSLKNRGSLKFKNIKKHLFSKFKKSKFYK